MACLKSSVEISYLATIGIIVSMVSRVMHATWWYTSVLCCIHYQRKGRNGIRLCVVSIRRGKGVRWYTCLFGWIASEGDVASAPTSREMSSRNDCIAFEGGISSVGYTFYIIVTCWVSYYMHGHVHSCLSCVCILSMQHFSVCPIRHQNWWLFEDTCNLLIDTHDLFHLRIFV